MLLCLSLGACLTSNDVQFRLRSEGATRVEVCLFQQPRETKEQVCFPMQLGRRAFVWEVAVPLSNLQNFGLSQPQDAPLYYGYRAWGPNWPYQPEWQRGTEIGFIADVDGQGNRFNPNKLLLDPYAFEVSHGLESVQYVSDFDSGAGQRHIDSAAQAPKAVLTPIESYSFASTKPMRPFKDDVIYEVHVKGLTANDPSIPFSYRGTYKGAGMKADYLRDLGVTAVEFLPVHQMTSTYNNYWGYMPMAYFAPQRSYSFDQSPGGPIREFREMVSEFHKRGIKVYTDVVYNHTGEGGTWSGDPSRAQLLSFRGIDNANYYNLSRDPAYYMDHTGCGNDLAGDEELVRDLIVDSLAHWKNQLGVDGFRFDLASVLGNTARGGSFYFDAHDSRNALNRARYELPVRSETGGEGVDLIAEPWAIGYGTYQLGRFPAGWAEWNGSFRDPVRSFYNKRGVESISLGKLAEALSGSANLFETSGRKPWHSINFITAHDGFTLRDLFSYNGKNNYQPYPFGPSDGGSDNNRSWDQNNDSNLQRQLTRTAFVTLLGAVGTPMIVGGDEFYRTLNGNNNAYNLDTIANYLPWPQLDEQTRLRDLVRHLLQLRSSIAGLRPQEFFRGQDGNRNGVKDLTWYGPSGTELPQSAFDEASGFIAYRIDNTEFSQNSDVRSIVILLNADFQGVHMQLPVTTGGSAWGLSVDTAQWWESQSNFAQRGSETKIEREYFVHPRSAVVLLELADKL